MKYWIGNLDLLKKLTVAGALLAMLSGCGDSKKAAPVAAAAGGVDGSGGKLSFIDGNSFEDWVVQEHKFYVRDLVHRLVQIRTHTPTAMDSIGPESAALASRFFGENPSDIQKLADSLTYYAVAGACPAANHVSSDASVSSDGRVCFSYRAFRNLSVRDAVPRLLAMTMHELSHLRGFNEAEATSWQLAFERGSLGRGTILTFNENYRLTKETLKKANGKVANALRALFTRREGAKAYACESLGQADDRLQDLLFFSYELPAYIRQDLTDSVRESILFAYASCPRKSELEIASTLAPILRSLASVARKLERYESPLCTGELCVGTRVSTGELEEVLLEWTAKQDKFARGELYPRVDPKKVVCQLQDLTDQRAIELTENRHGYYDLEAIEATDDMDGPQAMLLVPPRGETEATQTEVVIKLTHGGSVQLLSASGFVAHAFALHGILVPGTQEKSTVRFAVMNPERNAPSHSESRLLPLTDPPYTVRDVYALSIRRAPTVIKEYELSCQLQQ
jgi:hypothetical protein